MTDTHQYGLGTESVVDYPWGLYRGGKAMCSDGIVRTLKRISPTADTFFSVPASVSVCGKTVAGYVTVESARGYSTETEEDPCVLKFVAYEYRRNGTVLPKGAWRMDGMKKSKKVWTEAEINPQAIVTLFWDMSSGGDRKEPWDLIYIEAPQDVAEIVFYNRFGHNPNRVSCACCGADYSIHSESPLEEASEFHRSGGGYGISLVKFLNLDSVLFIPASDIRDDEKVGKLPEEGYVWVG